VRLGEGGFVAFVVSVATVAVHVDDDVAVELGPELEGQVDRLRDRLGLLPVHVNDRNLEHLGDVGRVLSRARFIGRGREADLVVHDDVNRAAGLVALESAHVERLLHDALPREGRVAVDEDAEPPRAVAVAVAILLGADAPEDDRVHELEVTGLKLSDRWTLLPEAVMRSLL
jgi:hypothetical protein